MSETQLQELKAKKDRVKKEIELLKETLKLEQELRTVKALRESISTKFSTKAKRYVKAGIKDFLHELWEF